MYDTGEFIGESVYIYGRGGEYVKKSYVKPLLSIEYYALTQSIASCSGIKIASSTPGQMPSREDIIADPDTTNAMHNALRRGGFLGPDLGCRISMIGRTDTDGVCYHTNINAAFNS